MPWARASSLHRHLECPAASHFPRLERGLWLPPYLATLALTVVTPPPFTEDSGPADWGKAMHAAKAREDASDPWASWVEPHRDVLWPDRLGRHEVSVAYNCATGEVHVHEARTEAERTEWTRSFGQDYVTGTCDWWAALPTGEPWIDDLKTGWKRPDVLTPQTMFYIMTRLKVANRGLAQPWTTGRVSITHWPRAKEPTEPSRSGLWRQVTDTALLAFEGEVRAAWLRTMQSNPEPRPGAHCLYCPSALVCPKANS